MNSSYIHDLRLLKGTFNPGNEANVVADAIANGTPRGNVRILDVGIGEGRAAFQFVDRLTSRGFAVHLTGIDLHLSREVRERATRNTRLLEMDFSAFPLSETFDAVVATQSLYYLGKRNFALRKLLDHAAPTGCLLVTIWSGNCILHDLHTRFVQMPDAECMTAEDLASELLGMEEDAQVTIVRTVGHVDIAKWLASEVTCRAAFRILSRINRGGDLDGASYDRFKARLQEFPAQMKRENGTVVLRRAKRGCAA